ncbi:hypothetical protein CTI12_AA039020 [Artemisia annua]|uniref:Helitron helicase-like domain-containing protein n=1 Tax=Artemisia annua TaxID=35608 RepID=A0A2U1QF29_ARTAN|nr:hypothetical protein CTI12_AA039020 [Artemisia annua]
MGQVWESGTAGVEVVVMLHVNGKWEEYKLKGLGWADGLGREEEEKGLKGVVPETVADQASEATRAAPERAQPMHDGAHVERLAASTRATGPLYNRCCRGGTVKLREIVEGLIHVLDQHNALVQLFRTARDKLRDADVPEFKVRLYGVGGATQYELPTADTLGAIVYEDGPESLSEFDMVIETHAGDSDPEGDGDKRVTMNAYYAYQIHDRNDTALSRAAGGLGSAGPSNATARPSTPLDITYA